MKQELNLNSEIYLMEHVLELGSLSFPLAHRSSPGQSVEQLCAQGMVLVLTDLNVKLGGHVKTHKVLLFNTIQQLQN